MESQTLNWFQWRSLGLEPQLNWANANASKTHAHEVVVGHQGMETMKSILIENTK
jgi:hypothetical protein